NGVQTMGNDEACTAFHKPMQSFLYFDLSNRIDTARCLIKHQYRWVRQNSPCNSQQLLLSLTNAAAIKLEQCVISAAHPYNEGVSISQHRCLLHLGIGRIELTITDILTYRSLE